DTPPIDGDAVEPELAEGAEENADVRLLLARMPERRNRRDRPRRLLSPDTAERAARADLDERAHLSLENRREPLRKAHRAAKVTRPILGIDDVSLRNPGARDVGHVRSRRRREADPAAISLELGD